MIWAYTSPYCFCWFFSIKTLFLPIQSSSTFPCLIFLTLQQAHPPISILTRRQPWEYTNVQARQHALENIQILCQLSLDSSVFSQFSSCQCSWKHTVCYLWPLIKNWTCLWDRKPQDVHVHFVEQTKSGKVRGGRPNFHNISSVETRETISSIHCRMKEYISKICLWNTMIKQNAD